MTNPRNPYLDSLRDEASRERMERIKPYLDFIDSAISNFTLPQAPEQLYDPARYILKRGGKRIRPVLVLMSCQLFCEDFSAAKNAAVAVELFHNFSLIHDDIMDKAPLRRGEPTVHAKWNENIAILSGDALLIEAYKLLCTYEPGLSQKLLRLFNTTATEVCEGQQMDMDFERNNSISIDQYLEMTRLKTAVLLGCSLKMGALIGGASEKDSEDLYQFGVYLGLAFQVQDDALDVYSDNKKFGKQTGGDILSNKKTYLSLCAWQDANAEQKRQLKQLENEPDPVRKVSGVKAIYDQLGVGSKAYEKMHPLMAEAVSRLNSLNVPSERKQSLRFLAEFIMSREF
jgi:geranylgeranyl diphosphate synthase, type II